MVSTSVTLVRDTRAWKEPSGHSQSGHADAGYQCSLLWFNPRALPGLRLGVCKNFVTTSALTLGNPESYTPPGNFRTGHKPAGGGYFGISALRALPRSSCWSPAGIGGCGGKAAVGGVTG